MTSSPPSMMSKDLSPASSDLINKWWLGLTPETQIELDNLYKLEQHEKIFVTFSARYVERNEEPTEAEVWVEEINELYEYLVNHEVTVYHFPSYVIHVCRIHPIGKTILANGRLEKDFCCPLDNGDCPFRKLSNFFENKEIKFFLKFTKQPLSL